MGVAARFIAPGGGAKSIVMGSSPSSVYGIVSFTWVTVKLVFDPATSIAS